MENPPRLTIQGKVSYEAHKQTEQERLERCLVSKALSVHLDVMQFWYQTQLGCGKPLIFRFYFTFMGPRKAEGMSEITSNDTAIPEGRKALGSSVSQDAWGW